MRDLQSSLKSKGEYVTQIIHFVGGVKRTFEGVSTSKIKQGQMTKLELKDGRIVMINDTNVLCVEVFSEDIE
jgi:hypothetical protein|tara:strand:- start:560 stop:775 length:216 start_codon:yes stop_codon:yes gene_type:complete